MAKTKKGYASLKEQFQNREIEKIYHLFVYGNLKDDRGTINLPIGRSNSSFKKWSAERGARGEKRDAITFFQVLKRAIDPPSHKASEGQSQPSFTKGLHHPVVGDKLYASGKEALLGFARLALHAREISFKDVSGVQHRVLANYPEDFQHAIDILG